MTKWQVQLLKALMTSYPEFQSFAKKQRNKKYLTQYMCKLFPIHKETIEHKERKMTAQGYIRTTKIEDIILPINIGIEFEYDRPGKVMSINEMESIVDKNIISLSSGYDENSDTDSCRSKNGKTSLSWYEYSSGTRLNEDRIRLKGYKGLKGLNKYLIWLNNNGKIAKNSSIHIHVDCDFDNSFRELYDRIFNWGDKDKTSIAKYLLHTKSPNILKYIHFPIDPRNDLNKNGYMHKELVSNNILDYMGSASSEHKTVEWRTFKASFQYEDVVAYILVAIHLTNCYKYKNRRVDDNFIKIIDKIRLEIKEQKEKHVI